MLLAKHGVLDALTKVLAKIQELQPENPLEVKLHPNIRMMTSLTLIFYTQFLHTNLAVSLAQQDTIRDLESKLSDANQEITRLQKEVDRFKQHQPGGNYGKGGAFGYSKDK